MKTNNFFCYNYKTRTAAIVESRETIRSPKWWERAPNYDRGAADGNCLIIAAYFETTDPQECGVEWLYDWELSGPDGAIYTIFAEPNATDEQITQVKRWFRHEHDVTGFRVRRIKRWLTPNLEQTQ